MLVGYRRTSEPYGIFTVEVTERVLAESVPMVFGTRALLKRAPVLTTCRGRRVLLLQLKTLIIFKGSSRTTEIPPEWSWRWGKGEIIEIVRIRCFLC